MSQSIPSKVFETYDEARNKSSSSSRHDFFEQLSGLPRPQMVVDDKKFLKTFSLRAQTLCLRDILLECMRNNPDAFVEFPAVCSVQNVATLRPTTECNYSVQLSRSILTAKLKQIESLITLYDKEMQWLSYGSRLWFGQLTTSNVTVFIDFSNEACFKDSYIDRVKAMNQWYLEQLQLCEVASISFFGSTVISPNSAKNPFASLLQPLGTCNMLSCLQSLVKSLDLFKQDHTLQFIICSKPDQSMELLHDYMIQIFAGTEIHLHFVAIDVGTNVQILLKKLSLHFDGHYHEYNSQGSNWDTIVQDILGEKQRAEECLLAIKKIIFGNTDEDLIKCLKQLSLVLELSLPCSICSSIHCIPYSSEDWLKAYGIEAYGLDLYKVLARDSFDQLSEYIPVIDKTALSIVYEVMPTFLWKDGTRKYLHVNVNKLLKYETDMKIYNSLLQLRLTWLQSGSRVIFGNLAEDRVLIVLDCSLKSSLCSDYFKYHLKMLLQEQISTKHSFNLIRYSGNKINEWKDSLCCSNDDTLIDAWRWTLEIKPCGTNNLLGCLQYTLKKYALSEIPSTTAGTSPIGIYVVLTSIPDQDVECINAYIEHLVCGCNVKLHIILYQPIVDNTEIETTLLKGIGRYGEDIDLQTYVTSLSSSSSSIRTLHKFVHGKFLGSTDYSKLIEEISKCRLYLKKNNDILTDYEAHCKKCVPESKTLLKNSETPFSNLQCCTPRSTHTSIARMNFNAEKIQEISKIEKMSGDKKLPSEKLYLSYRPLYTGNQLEKCLVLEFNSRTRCKPIYIPNEESYLSSFKWLNLYGLKKLGLDNKTLTPTSQNAFRHVTSKGNVVRLCVNRQQLNKLLWKLKQVRARYYNRLQWLLSDSKLLFGCVTEQKIVLLIDASASMEVCFTELKKHICGLINEQFQRRKRTFGIVSYGGERVNVWKTGLSCNTYDVILEAQKWLLSLTTKGSTNLLDGLKVSLELHPHAVYAITDGNTDHSPEFILSRIKHLKTLCPNVWTINTVAYHCQSSVRHSFLKELAHATGGRYHSYPVSSESVQNFLNDAELGDDLRHLIKEIKHADSTINDVQFYMGRHKVH